MPVSMQAASSSMSFLKDVTKILVWEENLILGILEIVVGLILEAWLLLQRSPNRVGQGRAYVGTTCEVEETTRGSPGSGTEADRQAEK